MMAIGAGVRDTVPLAVPAVPIGLILGVAIRESTVVDNLAGWSSSVLILAGAAQLTAVDLITRGAGLAAVLAAVAMINARHLMYSAALRHRFRSAPTWFRIAASYLMLDQTFALNVDGVGRRLETKPLDYQMPYYLASGLTMALPWQAATAAGILIGDVIPQEWEVGFSVPLMFLGLMVMSINDRPAVAAAVVGGTVSVAGRSWPSGSGLLAGAVLGVVAAGFLDWHANRHVGGDGS